jgi:hypothetical protein
VTDANGRFAFQQLSSGTYRVDIEKSGFAKISRCESSIRSSPTVKLRVRDTFGSSTSPARTTSIRPICSCP